MRKLIIGMITISVFSLIVPPLTWAVVINVPGDYSTIQNAIDAAFSGDTVQVNAGTYNEDISLKSGVTVQGAGAAMTTIQGTGSGPVVTAESVEEAKIDGFTITGGSSTTPGGGIYSYYSTSLTISNNIISGNSAPFAGGIYIDYSLYSASNPSPTIANNIITGNKKGGIYSFESSPTINNNIIEGNTGNDLGDGIGCTLGVPIITNNTITGNILGISVHTCAPIIINNTIKGNTGGGISSFESDPPIINNIIAENTGPGIYLVTSRGPVINNTITGNTGDPAGGISCIFCFVPPTIINSIVWGNGVDLANTDPSFPPTADHSCIGNPVLGGTNISGDPMFVDAAGGDYHLQSDSPCIDEGLNSAVPSWITTDFEGDPRIVNLTVDIGADEVAPPFDTVAPTITSTSPQDQATGVAVNSAVAVTFNEVMDTTSIAPSTYIVSDGSSNIAGKITFTTAADQTVATFTPSTTLSYSTTYTATITTGVTDDSGNALAQNYVWTFTTGPVPDKTPPIVIRTVPTSEASGVGIGSTISVIFSELMDTSTITKATFALTGADEGVTGTINFATSSGKTVATLTPSSPLAYATTYTGTVTTGVKDLAGNPMGQNHVWTFTTETAPDTIPPMVISTVPDSDTSGVSISTPITVTFSETMDQSSFNSTVFILTGGGSSVSCTVNVSGATATFTPSAQLAYNTEYTATVTTLVEDQAGNPMTSNHTWTFTTEVEPTNSTSGGGGGGGCSVTPGRKANDQSPPGMILALTLPLVILLLRRKFR